MKRHITEINNTDLKKSLFKNAQFVFFAEAGAMGEPGRVLVVTAGGSIFHGNYCMGNIDVNKLFRSLPVLKYFGDTGGVPDDWKYEYLGAGNHLLIRSDVYREFKHELREVEYPEDLYPIWLDAAWSIVQKRNKEKLPDATKTHEYREFVRKVQKNYDNTGNARVKYEPCDIWKAGNQINLWTYWQGYQLGDVERGVDILLVGQDWGNPDRQKNVVERIRQFQNGGQVNYADSTNPTDRMLIRLFAEIGYDITKENPGCRLFFTNYSLGYRAGSETGGMTKTLLLKDRKYFDELVSIIKPKNIICLGKLVYEVVADEKVRDFVKQLSTGTPLMAEYPLNNNIKVFGVPHCGARGMNNVGGYEVMRKIWIDMKKQL